MVAFKFSTVHHVVWQSLKMKSQNLKKKPLRKYLNTHFFYSVDGFMCKGDIPLCEMFIVF
jgi:hypothetical protein